MDAAVVSWRYDPRRETPVAAALAAAGALGMCALIVAARLPFVLAISLALACLASCAPALAAVECRADADGVARRGLFGWQRRPWAAIRRLAPVHGGVLVSPFAHPHPLDFTRAMLLPMPRGRRDELRAAVAAARNNPGSPGSRGSHDA